ncbi:hypothetical protein ACHAPV_005629, partial [Trichoderma viride]
MTHGLESRRASIPRLRRLREGPYPQFFVDGEHLPLPLVLTKPLGAWSGVPDGKQYGGYSRRRRVWEIVKCRRHRRWNVHFGVMCRLGPLVDIYGTAARTAPRADPRKYK